GGISQYTAWINTIGAPDILTNASRGVAMTFTDIWIQRLNPDTGQWEQTTLLNIIHEMGAAYKARYRHEHGVEPEDTPTGFIGGTEVAEFIKGKNKDLGVHDFRFFESEVLKQRLFVSYLAQYDAMPTDIKEKLFRKIAALKPQDIVSFYPDLLRVAMNASGTNNAAWERLHRKLIINSRDRIIKEGRQMLTYNETLKTIRDKHGGNEADARLAYAAEKGPLDHQLATGAINDATHAKRLKEIRERLGMDFENFDAWKEKLEKENFIYNPSSRLHGPLSPDQKRFIHDSRYEMRGKIFTSPYATLTAEEQAEYNLLTKIIDGAVGDQRRDAHGEWEFDSRGNPVVVGEPIAKKVSEAKLAYKVCLDDNPRISWRATGEGGGGGGKGMILSMYGDQAAVNQGVSEHLSRLLLDPITKAEEHIAALVEQFGIHYGLPGAQDMFKPLIVAFALMVKENFWARWTGKELRDFLQKPNSAMEEYFKVKGYSLDEIGIFKLFLNLTNHHAIRNEKETVGRRLQNVFKEHRNEHNQSNWDTVGDILKNRDGIIGKMWKKGIRGEGKSEFDKMLALVGADPAGRRKARARRILQLLLLFVPISIAKVLIPDEAKKAGGIA
ncbi:MAG: hypothetical protein HYV40_02450, partial [Candidatus Levybacteria bacterium]|nr:hypothetical protein [Candidatus Levybacteria bacterium]